MTRALFLLLSICVLSGCGKDSMVGPSDTMEEMEENSSTIRMGAFLPLAEGKEAMGSATLRVVDGGSLRLDFSDNFSLTNGPGLFVFLSNSEFPSPDAINLGGFISPEGVQMYDVPEGVSLDSFSYVAVHCVPYNVTFAFAELN